MLFLSAVLAQDDAAAYKAASEAEDVSRRIEALEAFVKNYPESSNKGPAYNRLFQAYLEINDGEKAVDAAENYLSTMPENNRGSAYNSLAWRMAEKKIALEKAAEYAKLAEDWARSTNNMRRVRNILDTRAYVHYQKGDYALAEELQREAVIGNEDDPEFIGRLAQYEEAVGKRFQALRTVVRTILYGGGEEYVTHFENWLAEEEPDPVKREALKTDIVMEIVREYLNEEDDDIDHGKRSQAASLMAQTRVNLPEAQQWAEEAQKSIDGKTKMGDIISYRTNLARVYYAREQYQQALETVAPLMDLVDPWNSGFWYMTGQIFEKTGQEQKALYAYLQGLVVLQPDNLMSAYSTLYTKVEGNAEGADAQIEKAQKALMNFNPGDYEGAIPSGGKVVLAELFTGAECSPCVGADYAFDALSQYYPRSMVAIVEHHLHIPGPDPLTNNDSESRYKFYGQNFGTPTVFINGTDKITGGGPQIVTKNRFTFYDHTIQKHFSNSKPAVAISGSADLKKDAVKVDLQIKAPDQNALAGKSINLNIALVERSVDYEGGNGVAHHAFVVRKLVSGGEGIPLEMKEGSISIRKTIELKAVERELSAYLNEFAEKNANRFRSSDGWRARPGKLNRDNLAVVAWVQDVEGKEVLQALYQKVATASAAR
jgi:tetratricopeptide (TPR) repeat protein